MINAYSVTIKIEKTYINSYFFQIYANINKLYELKRKKTIQVRPS